MIDQITLSGENANLTTVNLTPITIFVGPNNSGKSLVLREIQDFISNGVFQSKKILYKMRFSKIEDPEALIETYTIPALPNETLSPGQIKFGTYNDNSKVFRGPLLNCLKELDANSQTYCSLFLRRKILKLDGHSRIQLTRDMAIGNLKQPETLLAKLFVDDVRREKIRRIVHDAFKKYFVLDPTHSPNFTICLSDEFPDPLIEKSLGKSAIEFYEKATSIHETSDGTKAYVGMITSIFSEDAKIIVIDEPEAFLHPPLASKLGLEISKVSTEGNNRTFVSTHSVNFLMGCIKSGIGINVIRLTYFNDIGKVRVLDNGKIKEMMNDPMLRSTGVLDALFYQHVVVTEGEIDRAFYSEINNRLVESDSSFGIDNCLFLSANGKDNIHRIVRPLREMGIPTAAIYDLDIIKNEGNTWTNALNSSFLPPGAVTTLGQTRGGINAKYKALDVDMKKHGINGLTAEEKPTAEWLINQLNPYGAFIVEKGEVECWLKDLQVPGSKTYWLTKMFQKMGSDKLDENYIKPGSDDVWQFMRSIKTWLENERRHGMPD